MEGRTGDRPALSDVVVLLLDCQQSYQGRLKCCSSAAGTCLEDMGIGLLPTTTETNWYQRRRTCSVFR